jgi:hypothetical protein
MPSFLTKVGVKLPGGRWKVSYCRNTTVLPFHHCQVLLGCCLCLLYLDWFRSGRGLQFLDKLGQNPTPIKEVGIQAHKTQTQLAILTQLLSVDIHCAFEYEARSNACNTEQATPFISKPSNQEGYYYSPHLNQTTSRELRSILCFILLRSNLRYYNLFSDYQCWSARPLL